VQYFLASGAVKIFFIFFLTPKYRKYIFETMKTATYLLKMTDKEKKDAEKRASALGMSLAAYLRWVMKLETESKIKEPVKDLRN